VKPKRGRPAPRGRKEPTSIRVLPDIKAFRAAHPKVFAAALERMESAIRRTKEFKRWKTQGTQL